MNRNKVLSALVFSIREFCAGKPVSACMFSFLPQYDRRVLAFPFRNAEVRRALLLFAAVFAAAREVF